MQLMKEKENKEKKQKVSDTLAKDQKAVQAKAKPSGIVLPQSDFHPIHGRSVAPVQRRYDDLGKDHSKTPDKNLKYFQNQLISEALKRLMVNRNEVAAVKKKYSVLQSSPNSEQATEVWDGFTLAMAKDKELEKREKQILKLKSKVQWESSGLINVRGPVSQETIDKWAEAAKERRAVIERYDLYLQYVYESRRLLNSEYPVTRLVDSKKGGDLNKNDAFSEILKACTDAEKTFDEVREKTLNGDMPLYKMDMIVNEVLSREGITPESQDGYSKDVNNWLNDERRANKIIEILGMAVPIALGLACFIPGIGLGAIVALGAIGAGVGGAVSAYEFEIADDLNDAGKASKAGSQDLVNPEEAKMQYIMASVGLCLSAVDAFLAGKAGVALLRVSKVAGSTSAKAGKLLKLLDEQSVTKLAKLSDAKMKLIFENMENAEYLATMLKSKKAYNQLLTLSEENITELLKTGSDDLGVKLINYGVDDSKKAFKGLDAEEAHNRLVLKDAESGKISEGIYKKEYLEELKSFDDNIGEVLNEFKLTRDEFQKLKMKRIEDLTPDEQALLKRIRELVPHPTEKTLLQKVIPLSEVRHYFKKEEYYNTIQGFIARAGDGMPYVSYDDIVETFRLDYSWIDDVTGLRKAPFLDDTSGYGLIRFKSNDIENIEIPYGKAMGGKAKDPAPCTLNGYAGGRNDSIIPEFFAPRDTPLGLNNSAEFYIVDARGNEKLIARYDDLEGKFIKIK